MNPSEYTQITKIKLQSELLCGETELNYIMFRFSQNFSESHPILEL